MRTRTLLVLAVVVGLLILVAGTIQLLRLDDSGSGSDDLAIGDTARAGDLEITVIEAEEADGELVVRVRVKGVDDPAGFDDFVLLAGAIIDANAPIADGDCRELTVAEQTCELTFDVSDVSGDVRVLRVRRGEDQRRWVVG